jgi:hypothetical protein
LPPKLGRYYIRATVIPLCVNIVAYMVFTIIDRNWGPGKDYKSEWLTADSLDGIVFLLLLANGVIIAPSPT